jgi:hypothetical protein
VCRCSLTVKKKSTLGKAAGLTNRLATTPEEVRINSLMIPGGIRALLEGNHEPPPTALLAKLNELLTAVPSDATAAMMTGTTNTSITAYSAAVGPSSPARK